MKPNVLKRKPLKELLELLKSARNWRSLHLTGKIKATGKMVKLNQAEIDQLRYWVVNYPTSERWNK